MFLNVYSVSKHAIFSTPVPSPLSHHHYTLFRKFLDPRLYTILADPNPNPIKLLLFVIL